MLSFEKRDFPNLENGKKYTFDCVVTSSGVHCIKGTTGPIEMGVNVKVFPEGERATYPTPDPHVILHEVKTGDFIGEYDKTEKRIRLRSFKVCEINDDRIIALGADEIFIFPSKE